MYLIYVQINYSMILTYCSYLDLESHVNYTTKTLGRLKILILRVLYTLSEEINDMSYCFGVLLMLNKDDLLSR